MAARRLEMDQLAAKQARETMGSEQAETVELIK